MSHLPRWNPFRCMRGTADPQGSSSRPLVELYNNGTGADLLLIWSVAMGSGAAAPGVSAGVEQGHTAQTRGIETPVVTGWMPQSGQIFSATSSSALTLDYGCTGSSAALPLQGSGVPICVLQPGWSFFLQNRSTGNNDIPIGIIWQAVHPDDLMGKRCAICDRGTHT